MNNIINKEDIYKVIPLKIITRLTKSFILDIEGIHGINHWLRVMTNGLILADQEKVSKSIPILFALSHDIFRNNDDFDPLHGERAAKAIDILKSHVNLTQEEILIVKEACKYHSDGKTTEEKEIGICWDADRLDLMRVGLYPDEKYLSTKTAKIEGLIINCNKYAIRDNLNDLCTEIKKDVYIELNNYNKRKKFGLF